METKIIRVNPENPETKAIAEAVEVLRQGGLVAFPTETVYGVGANALNEDAVGRIFKAKGRSREKPLAICIPRLESVHLLVGEVSPLVQNLIHQFWPGPLTLVFPYFKLSPETEGFFISDLVRAGHNTIAIRFPANQVALTLLKGLEFPLALTSANLSGHRSPATAEQVREELGGRINLILDGGPTKLVLESTVLDLTTSPPRILREGAISAATLAPWLEGRKVPVRKAP